MDSKRSGIVLVLMVLASLVNAAFDPPVVPPVVFPIAEPWVPGEDIAGTLERMCRYKCLVSTGGFWGTFRKVLGGT